jgi:hypothetical protein
VSASGTNHSNETYECDALVVGSGAAGPLPNTRSTKNQPAGCSESVRGLEAQAGLSTRQIEGVRWWKWLIAPGPLSANS